MTQAIHAARAWKTMTGLEHTATSTQFLERARDYRYAAALTDNPRTANALLDLAFMFERLARDFARVELRKQTAGFPRNMGKLSARLIVQETAARDPYPH